MIIEGKYHTKTWYGPVYIDGSILNPTRSQGVYNHSPDGFAWGYGGSGPAQLALAILLAAGLSDKKAVALYQRFKAEFIVPLPRDSFTIEVDVLAWVARTEPVIVMPSDVTVGLTGVGATLKGGLAPEDKDVK